MRGASAVEELLEGLRDRSVLVLVVWEPVLWSDIAPPANAVLARLSDSRARQFWDPHRALSQELAGEAAEPNRAIGSDAAGRDSATHEDRGPRRSQEIVWDFVALYPAGARWEARVPEAVWQDGPVARVIDGLRAHLTALAP